MEGGSEEGCSLKESVHGFHLKHAMVIYISHPYHKL